MRCSLYYRHVCSLPAIACWFFVRLYNTTSIWNSLRQIKLQQISGTRFRKLKEAFVIGRFRTLRRGCNLLQVLWLPQGQQDIKENFQPCNGGSRGEKWNNSPAIRASNRGTQRQFSGKYLLGRRFEIYNFRSICCKISCLPVSPRIFEHLQNGIITHF